MPASTPNLKLGSVALAVVVLVVALAVLGLLVWALGPPAPGSGGSERGAPDGPRAPVAPDELTGIGAREQAAGEEPGTESVSDRTALSAAGPSAEQTIRWSGTVVDARDTSAVEGATVKLRAGEREAVARTGEDGAFELEWPADLAARLSIEHPRYVDARAASVELGREGSFELWPSAVLRGWIDPPPESDGARAIAWAAIASSTRSWKRHEVEVLADGRFEFQDLAPGEYALSADVPGRHTAAEAGLRLEAGQTLDVLLETHPDTRVRGRVFERDGNRSVPKARISASPRAAGLPRASEGERTLVVRSDAEGRYELEGLGPGDWRLEFVTPWGGRTRRELKVAESGDTIVLDVDVGAPAAVLGRVVDARGTGVAGIEVVAVASRWREPLRAVVAGVAAEDQPRAVTAADGSFQLERVAAGRALSLFAQPPAGPVGARPPTGFARLGKLEPGSRTLGVEIELVQDAALAGVVLDEGGAAIPKASVKVHAELDGTWLVIGRTRTDAAGRFEVEGLCSSQVTVQVEHEDYLQQELPVQLGGPELELRLTSASVVRGRALDQRGLGVPDVPVAATGCDAAGNVPERRDAREIHRSRTNAYGEFTLRGLPQGNWLVIASSYEWRQLESSPAILVTPADASIELSMTPRERPLRASLSGTIVLAEGGLPTGVELRGLHGGVVTIDAGHFKATGLVPTRHRLIVQADGHAERRIERIDLRPGQLTDLGTIELLPATRVVVQVRDAAGAPVDGLGVRLLTLPAADGGAGAGARSLSLKRRGPGRYETGGVTRHTWRLVVRGEGWKRRVRSLRVEAQARQVVDVVLEPAD